MGLDSIVIVRITTEGVCCVDGGLQIAISILDFRNFLSEINSRTNQLSVINNPLRE